MFSKIRNDTFRTLATDLEFREKVGEDRLVRCLEAFVWRQLGAASPPHTLEVELNSFIFPRRRCTIKRLIRATFSTSRSND
jgi:hypothetical protein